MCFAPQADLVGGLAIGAIGIDAIRHSGGRADHLALASLPLLLGVHQLDEAVVWWGLQGQAPASAGRVALWIYLVIAFVVLPAGIPIAVMRLEPNRRRRRMMAPLAAVGAIVGATLLTSLIRGPFGASVQPYHLAYSAPLNHGLIIVGAYVAAVCIPLLLSSFRHVAVFGVANLVAVAVLTRLTIDGFASIWCAYAAVASGAIALHMRFADRHQRTEALMLRC